MKMIKEFYLDKITMPAILKEINEKNKNEYRALEVECNLIIPFIMFGDSLYDELNKRLNPEYKLAINKAFPHPYESFSYILFIE